MTDVINCTVCMCSALIALILFSGMLIKPRRLSGSQKAFYLMLGLDFLTCLLGGFTYIEGYPAWILAAFSVAFYALMFSYVVYCVSIILERRRVRLTAIYVSGAICALDAVLYIILNCLGFELTGDSGTSVDAIYWLFTLMGLAPITIAVIILTENMRYIGRARALILMLLPIVPFIISEIVKAYTGIYLRQLSTTASLVFFYVYIHVKDAQRVAEQERQLAQERIRITLSQIKPHFLFNALSAIYYICDTDPIKAQTAIGDFAKYLRMNLDYMDKEQLIPFSSELQHTRYYLNLEQMRLGDRLRVEYDIKATDFLMPMLSLQPLAENAVKHGISPLKQGGLILISSRETADQFIVSVYNDGVGLGTVNPLSADEHSHIGLNSVQNRLTLLCGGRLELRPVNNGKGMIATLTIPRIDELPRAVISEQ